MEFQDVVRKRRMVRSFLDKPVPRETVDRILRNATKAPSAGFSQGWAFIALEGSEQTGVFWDACNEGMPPSRQEGVATAPVIIIPLSNKAAYLERYSRPDKAAFGLGEDETKWPAPFWDIDTAMASMNMLLTCVDEGLGALFFGISSGEKELMERLGVPASYKPIGAIALGWPDPDDRPSPSLKNVGRRPTSETLHFGRWAGAR
ncbi:MAG: nitroreductase family protein [Actinobacteria bacterium]|nr:nitroreductase family protein [Actinomycetota bacterium]